MSWKAHKKPIKVEIKNEKSELHSMSHYVDDRVELIKQIFTVLKWKTIRNLAPESLKKSGIAEIEELCLNELLGLSTKRLISIINATKCPTDTESSSESDVEKIEEHISLEEISSDSETERNRQASRSKTTKKARKKEHGNKSNAKGVSVLELLELQARARAIRSQLALEPVAKIEVDSDDSQDELRNQASSSKRPNEEQSMSGKRPIEAVKTPVNGEDEKKTKRIKLKRNFRKQNQSTTGDEADESDATKSDKKQESDKNKAETKDASKEIKSDKKPSPDKETEKERSPSPDVITILPSPETFFISDSSDEETSMNKPSQSEPAKVNESAEKRSGSENATKASADAPRQVSATEPESVAETVANARKEPEVPEDPEDGEIIDFDETIKSDDAQPEAEVSNETEPVAPMESNSQESKAANSNISAAKDEAKSSKSSIHEIIANSHDESSSDSASSKASSPKNREKQNGDSDPDQIQNDDAISLLGHEDLGEEPNRPELAPSKEETTPAGTESQSKPDENLDDDIITLDNSSDEESSLNKFGNADQNDSWNCRWLKSNRVSKILATSRLGNRLRDKIKKSKKQSEQAAEEEAPPEPAIEEKFKSQYEDGSIKQYEEILERERSNPN